MTSTPQSGKELLARIRPTVREESTQLCLRPDLIARWQELEELLTAALSQTGERLGSGVSKEARGYAEEQQAVEAEIDETSFTVWMRPIGKPRWQTLCDANPPREEFLTDQMVGYNTEAVLDDAVRECTFDPVFEDCTDEECTHEECGTWQQIESRNPAEWQELRELCKRVNDRVVVPPKSALASLALRKPSSGSASRAASRPARSGSTGGSRQRSTSSST